MLICGPVKCKLDWNDNLDAIFETKFFMGSTGGASG